MIRGPISISSSVESRFPDDPAAPYRSLQTLARRLRRLNEPGQFFLGSIDSLPPGWAHRLGTFCNVSKKQRPMTFAPHCQNLLATHGRGRRTRQPAYRLLTHRSLPIRSPQQSGRRSSGPFERTVHFSRTPAFLRPATSISTKSLRNCGLLEKAKPSCW